MKKIITITFLLSISVISFARPENKDSIAIKNLENKLEQLDNQLKEVRRDELNYHIEKDLLKETYSNNYERINLFLTVILGIFGLLSFLGIRDLNSIKKEYREELDKLKKLKLDVDFKSKDFEESKKKYDKEIMEIIKQNEEQSNKLKIIEIREKISNLYTQKNYDRALEYCIVALELAPNDINFLLQKALIYTKGKKYDEVSPIYSRIIELESTHSTAISNIAEVYLFQKNEKSSDEIIAKHSDLFKKKSEGEVLRFFELIKLFNKPDVKNLKEIVVAKIDRKDLMNKKKRMEGWDVSDALTYVRSEPESEQQTIFLNYIWYLDGQLNAKEALERLGIKVTEETPTSTKS
jgi:tetratricopeptide (TPR) repeat protein